VGDAAEEVCEGEGAGWGVGQKARARIR